jgi:tetratricopeptide (TPR) repeat protein
MTAARRAFASGDVATAERICAELVGRTPGNADAWMLLTETALRRGRADAAMVCANRAVALAPKDPIAQILRAKCLFVSGEATQALEAAEIAEQIVGDTAQALDALGAIFGLLGLHHRAKEYFVRAVAIRPDQPQCLFNLAATERMTGALAEAEIHCDAAIARERNYGLAYYLRSDLRIQTAQRNHIADIETLIGEGRLTPTNEVLLRFALAKEYEDLDQPGRTFDHVEAACRLHRRSITYDSAAEIAEIDKIIQAHDRRWSASAPEGYSAAAPVFVAGLPRTGTTLVERIIASHPAMTSAGETGAFGAGIHRAIAPVPSGSARQIDLVDIGRRYVGAVTAFRVPRDARFVDKTLQNYLYCGLIHAALPKAKIILVQRHPLDACWAIYKAHFQGKFSFAYDQLELAEYYLAFRRLARHWRTTLPPHALLEISYEDVVRNQAAVSQRLMSFLELPWSDEVLRFHESPAPSATASAVQVRRPIYSSSIGKWRAHAERLIPLRERLAREIPAAELD